jgi:hypothetical protein
MASLLTVRRALIERLNSQFDLNYYWFVPDQLVTPAVVVQPDRPVADLEQTFSSGYAKWNFVITLVVDRTEEEAAQEQLSTWIDPAGPFIGALRDCDADDSLSRLTSDVHVTAIDRLEEMVFGGIPYYYASLRVSVKA